MKRLNRYAASGAIWGPAWFIASWVIGGLRTNGYSPIQDAISRLAAVQADTSGLMNTGFVAYGVGVTAAAWPLRTIIGKPAAVALAINALLTFGVLATPLEKSETVDQLHTVFAGAAYAALAAAGLLAARHLAKNGHPVASKTAAAVGSVTGLSLFAVVFDVSSGLFQRIGLTTSDLAMMAAAIAYLRKATIGKAG